MHRFDFTPYRRTTVGFDHLFELLETAGRPQHNENYPPFNIERVGENNYEITVAVAGFKQSEIEIIAQQNMLIVSGCKDTDSNDNRDFLHMGIASRNFERRFQLSDHVQVTHADLSDGLLKISLLREIPEASKPRKIAIGANNILDSLNHDEISESDSEKA